MPKSTHHLPHDRKLVLVAEMKWFASMLKAEALADVC